MSQQVFPGGIMTPSLLNYTNNPSFTVVLLDAAAEKFAFVFQAPDTGTIDSMEFRVGAVSINAASVMRVSLQDVSATTGDPDGTQDQYRDISGAAITSNTWITPGLLTSDGTDNGTKRTVTRGDLLCLVVEYQTFTAADSVNVNGWNAVAAAVVGLPYVTHFTAAWSKRDFLPVCALKYSDGAYHHISPAVYPISAVNSVAFNNASTPDERGMNFSFPFPCVLRGCSAVVSVTGATTGGFVVTLYGSDGSTVSRSVTVDPDIKQSTGVRMHTYTFADISLLANTTYKITIVPNSATNVTVYNIDVPTAAHLVAMEGNGAWTHTERTDAGAWTNTTTKRPMMGLWIASFDDGGGDGNGIPWPIGHRWHRNMN